MNELTREKRTKQILQRVRKTANKSNCRRKDGISKDRKMLTVISAITCMIQSYTHATKKELLRNRINFKKDVLSLVMNGIYLWKRNKKNGLFVLRCWYCATTFVDWCNIDTLVSVHNCIWSNLSSSSISCEQPE